MSIDYLLSILLYFFQIFLLFYKLKVILKHSVYHHYKLLLSIILYISYIKPLVVDIANTLKHNWVIIKLNNLQNYFLWCI